MHTHPTFGRAMLGGAAGTLMMTAMMYLVAPMMGLHMDVAAMMGSMLGGSWAAGMMMHVINGAVLFPALYAFIVEPTLPGTPVMRGALWGTGLWLVAQAIVMPRWEPACSAAPSAGRWPPWRRSLVTCCTAPCSGPSRARLTRTSRTPPEGGVTSLFRSHGCRRRWPPASA